MTIVFYHLMDIKQYIYSCLKLSTQKQMMGHDFKECWDDLRAGHPITVGRVLVTLNTSVDEMEIRVTGPRDTLARVMTAVYKHDTESERFAAFVVLDIRPYQPALDIVCKSCENEDLKIGFAVCYPVLCEAASSKHAFCDSGEDSDDSDEVSSGIVDSDVDEDVSVLSDCHFTFIEFIWTMNYVEFSGPSKVVLHLAGILERFRSCMIFSTANDDHHTLAVFAGKENTLIDVCNHVFSLLHSRLK
jgi:hypothetical protein